jgi:DNA helicase-2/ATP-dependent DNA helicase PcrA
MEEGVFPHQRSLDEQNVEEERRLAYVGMTRAMDRLYLLHARSRSLWGSGQYNLPSRFLEEIPERLVERQSIGGPAGGRGGSWGGSGGWGGTGGWGGGSGGRGGGGWDEERGGGSGWRGGAGRGWRSGRDQDEVAEDHATLGSGRRVQSGGGHGLDEEVVEQYFAAGERVLHATLGEGTVLAVESGGIVLVRFESDGSERRLMASVAPLRRLRG